MFKLLILTALFGLSVAAVHNNYNAYRHTSSAYQGASSDDVHAEIKTLHSDVRHDGFDYALDTTNGIHAAQSGDQAGNVHGDYEYVSPEGVHVKVVYVADENGYQPSSELLPTPPPIPAAILRSLEYIRTHPSKDEYYTGAVQRTQYRAPTYGRKY